MVEIYQADLGDAGAGEGGACVRAHAAAADYDDEGVAEFGEAFVAQEDAVPGELFEDELVVEVAGLGALGEEEVVLIFSVRFGEGADTV